MRKPKEYDYQVQIFSVEDPKNPIRIRVSAFNSIILKEYLRDNYQEGEIFTHENKCYQIMGIDFKFNGKEEGTKEGNKRKNTRKWTTVF